MKTKTCMYDDCDIEPMPSKRLCAWHWLLKQSPDIQIQAAKERRAGTDMVAAGWGGPYPLARVPKADWPEGTRFCAGCQMFVPLFYCTGSRCKAHASLASHGARIEKLYGITPKEYDALMVLQGGVCFICGRKSNTKRLAVDHDHRTGRVRGLLCPDVERGCNHAILGNIRDLDMAKRIVAYLENPPYDQLEDS